VKQQNIRINTVLNAVKTISSIIFSLVTFPYASRVLMPENIGKVNFGSSFVSYFSLIATLGITTYAIRECSIRKDKREELSKLSSQIFSINVCTTFIAYFLMAITFLFFRELDSYRELIIIQSTVIIFTTLGCDWINSAMEDFKFIAIRTIVFQIISTILLFVFVKAPDDYIKYAFIMIISSSGANVLNMFYTRKYCNIGFVKNMDLKEHIKPISLLFVMILAQTIFNSSDITMLGLMKGDYEVGLYSSAVKMKQLVSQIVASLVWVLMPRMSLYFENNEFGKINELLRKALNVLITIGLPCAVGVSCLTKETILLIAGNEYVSASNTLVILMIGFILSLYGGSFLGNMVLLPSKREFVFMCICCASAAINIVLNYILIPIGGANAAAASTSFSGLVIFILLIITKDKRIQINNKLSLFLPPIIGCIGIIASCLLVKQLNMSLFSRFFISICCSGTIYLLIQFALKNELICVEMISLLRKVANIWKKK